MGTESMGQLLDRNLLCGAPGYTWIRFKDSKRYVRCSTNQPSGVSRPPCGKPLGSGHWLLWELGGMSFAECPHCQAATAFRYHGPSGSVAGESIVRGRAHRGRLG